MTKIPGTLIDRIDTALELKQEPPRAHLGCSLIGHHCDRYLWLNFRWSVVEKFSGRTLRIFRRGQNEEEHVINDLQLAGLKVNGEQTRVSLAPHFSGSLDGVVTNVPESPNKEHVLEIKTSNVKQFDKLVKEGVEKAKPQHYAQMQCYMMGLNLERALYVCVCKDDDRYYTERVRFDKAFAEKMVDKAKRIITSDRMPEPCSVDPSWYQCKWCAAHDFCFGSKCTKEVNCRTCAHVTFNADGVLCERFGAVVPKEFQHEGCDCHVIHPELVPFEYQGSKSGLEAIFIINDVPVRNGEPDAHCLSSKEIIKGLEDFHPFVEKIVEVFGGTVSAHQKGQDNVPMS